MVPNCCATQNTLHDGHDNTNTIWHSPSDVPLGSGRAGPYASKGPNLNNRRSPHLVLDYQGARKEGKIKMRLEKREQSHDSSTSCSGMQEYITRKSRLQKDSSRRT